MISKHLLLFWIQPSSKSVLQGSLGTYHLTSWSLLLKCGISQVGFEFVLECDLGVRWFWVDNLGWRSPFFPAFVFFFLLCTYASFNLTCSLHSFSFSTSWIWLEEIPCYYTNTFHNLLFDTLSYGKHSPSVTSTPQERSRSYTVHYFFSLIEKIFIDQIVYHLHLNRNWLFTTWPSKVAKILCVCVSVYFSFT